MKEITKSLMLEIYAYGIDEKPWNLPKCEIIIIIIIIFKNEVILEV
jgi:hypothetical protein